MNDRWDLETLLQISAPEDDSLIAPPSTEELVARIARSHPRLDQRSRTLVILYAIVSAMITLLLMASLAYPWYWIAGTLLANTFVALVGWRAVRACL